MNSRMPAEAVPLRMESLARLPVFYALSRKRTVVAGGSAAAAWKAELLAAAGASVAVYADEPGEEMRALATQATIELHRCAIGQADLAGAAMAIGDFTDDSEAAAFATLA